jgi:hypothetical protein
VYRGVGKKTIAPRPFLLIVAAPGKADGKMRESVTPPQPGIELFGRVSSLSPYMTTLRLMTEMLV